MRDREIAGDVSTSLRPKAARQDATESARALRAALSGRLDAVGPGDVVELQRAAGNSATTSLLDENRSPVRDVLSSGGTPLPHEVRSEMERRFDQDFGDVRVHTDTAARDSAKDFGAHAYTVGSDIVLQHDDDLESQTGAHLLAHELTHVVQQRTGPVDGTDVGGGVRLSDPADPFEREAAANAERIMSPPNKEP